MADPDAQIQTFERPSDEELRARLTPLQYEVTQQAGTERAFTGVYWDEHRSGTYKCIVCGLELFESDAKYESGSGWPSFWKPIADDRVTLKEGEIELLRLTGEAKPPEGVRVTVTVPEPPRRIVSALGEVARAKSGCGVGSGAGGGGVGLPPPARATGPAA